MCDEGNKVALITDIDRADRMAAQGDGNHRPSLDPQLRQQIVCELEKCMTDKRHLRAYLRVLQRVMDNQARYDDAECLENEEWLRGITERGLTALDDAVLMRLALNPVALCALADHIIDSVFTDYWTDVLARAGEDSVSDDKFRRQLDDESPALSMEAAPDTPSWEDMSEIGHAFRASLRGQGDELEADDNQIS